MIITHYKQIDGKGALKASFNVTLPKWSNFEIRNLTLFESNGKRFVSMPSRQYDDPQGKKKYFAYCAFPDHDVNDKFNTAILAALDQHIAQLPPVERVTLPPARGTSLASVKDLDDDLPF